jgi:hypothetical protein
MKMSRLNVRQRIGRCKIVTPPHSRVYHPGSGRGKAGKSTLPLPKPGWCVYKCRGGDGSQAGRLYRALKWLDAPVAVLVSLKILKSDVRERIRDKMAEIDGLACHRNQEYLVQER